MIFIISEYHAGNTYDEPNPETRKAACTVREFCLVNQIGQLMVIGWKQEAKKPLPYKIQQM